MSADKGRQEVRQEMYKNYNRSPCWKEQFRKRCLQRLKESRGSYLSSRRSFDNLLETDSDVNGKRETGCHENDCADKTVEKITQERPPCIDIIMKEEFDRLKGEVSLSKDIGSKSGVTNQQIDYFCDTKNFQDYLCQAAENHHRSKEGDNYNFSGIHEKNCLDVNELVSWYEEIYDILRAELKETQEKEERLRLQEVCDEHLTHEQQELCSALQALSTEEVICPICERFNLMESKSVIQCRCGLKIDIEQDSITLKYVRDSLTAGMDEHSQRCESKPTFSLNQKFGISNLLMSCQDCDFLFVIL